MAERTLPFSVPDLPADIRLEVVASELLDNGFTLDEVLVAPKGGYNRNYRHEVVELRPPAGLEGPESFLQIDVARAGLYDSLPQNFFHDTIDDIIDGKRLSAHEQALRIADEEFQARAFFLPIEKEFYRARILLEQQERKAMIGYADHFKFDIFLRLWPELADVDAAYLPALLQVLPVAQHFVGDLEAINKLFPVVLAAGVRAERMPVPTTRTHNGALAALGANTLGQTLMLGTVFPDYDPGIKLTIGPLTAEHLQDFMPDCKADKVLRMLIRYYLPLETDAEIVFTMGPAQHDATLDDGAAAPGRLGISTALGGGLGLGDGPATISQANLQNGLPLPSQTSTFAGATSTYQTLHTNRQGLGQPV